MFDMLLESGQRSPLVSSWGKGVALTLHVAVLGALWRAPATPAPAPIPPYIDIIPPEPVTGAPEEHLPVPPVPPCRCEEITVPPVEIPPIPEGVLRPRVIGPIGDPPVTSTPDSRPSPGSVAGVFPVALVQVPPELLLAPPPAYPWTLRAAGVQGQVIVAAVIDTLGQAEAGSVQIVLSDNPGFDTAALATVRAARFRPARISGRAVRVLVRVPVVFRLN